MSNYTLPIRTDKLCERVDILGCPFDAISFDDTVNAIRHAVKTDGLLQVVPGSIDFVMKARRDPIFREELRRADLVIADGMPIVWAASLLGTPIRGRVSGTELVWSSAAVSAELDTPVALIGAMPGVAARAAAEMMRRYPGARVVDFATPWPLTHDDSCRIADQVRTVGAKIVMVALGAPRQERWVQRYLAKCGANVGIGIGSAFDIISGDKPRAPALMQNCGLEWLHRMALEPKRLGRRYLIEDSPFLFLLTKELLFRTSRQGSSS